MGLKEWLENWSIRDLKKWERENPTYDPERDHAPANEYLFYINQKLKFANTRLERIETALIMLTIMGGFAFVKYLGLF